MIEATKLKQANTIDPEHREFVASHRVAHLATADTVGTPSVVPICFAMLDDDEGSWIAIALDEKPKGDLWRLKRVRNILARPEVSIVVDDYSLTFANGKSLAIEP